MVSSPVHDPEALHHHHPCNHKSCGTGSCGYQIADSLIGIVTLRQSCVCLLLLRISACHGCDIFQSKCKATTLPRKFRTTCLTGTVFVTKFTRISSGSCSLCVPQLVLVDRHDLTTLHPTFKKNCIFTHEQHLCNSSQPFLPLEHQS